MLSAGCARCRTRIALSLASLSRSQVCRQFSLTTSHKSSLAAALRESKRTKHGSLRARDSRSPRETARDLDAYTVRDEIARLLKTGEKAQISGILRKYNDLDLTVSWNLLIQHKLDHGSISGALDEFNAMKKVGQWPNAHTYSLLLAGLRTKAARVSPERCLKVIKDLTEDKRNKPNAVHLSNALGFCLAMPATTDGQALDLAYNIIEEFAEAGMREYSAPVFTLLFKIMHKQLVKQAMTQPLAAAPEEGEGAAGSAARKASVEDCKQLWADVEAAVSEKRLKADGELIQAYAACLSCGTPQDALLGLELMCLATDMPLPSAVQSQYDRTLARKIQPQAPLEPQFMTIHVVLRLVRATERLNLLPPFWDYIREWDRDKPSREVWHAYLDAARVMGGRDEAAAAVDAMLEQDKTLVSPATLVKAMLAQRSKDRTSSGLTKGARLYEHIYDLYPANAASSTPLVSSFAGIFRHATNGTPASEAARAANVLNRFAWERIAKALHAGESGSEDLTEFPRTSNSKGALSKVSRADAPREQRALLTKAATDILPVAETYIRHIRDPKHKEPIEILRKQVVEVVKLLDPESKFLRSRPKAIGDGRYNLQNSPETASTSPGALVRGRHDVKQSRASASRTRVPARHAASFSTSASSHKPAQRQHKPRPCSPEQSKSRRTTMNNEDDLPGLLTAEQEAMHAPALARSPGSSWALSDLDDRRSSAPRPPKKGLQPHRPVEGKLYSPRAHKLKGKSAFEKRLTPTPAAKPARAAGGKWAKSEAIAAVTAAAAAYEASDEALAAARAREQELKKVRHTRQSREQILQEQVATSIDTNSNTTTAATPAAATPDVVDSRDVRHLFDNI
ncbi:hypothetical protein PYCC9005_003624 [Savitreella phatthalungensis]